MALYQTKAEWAKKCHFYSSRLLKSGKTLSPPRRKGSARVASRVRVLSELPSSRPLGSTVGCQAVGRAHSAEHRAQTVEEGKKVSNLCSMSGKRGQHSS